MQAMGYKSNVKYKNNKYTMLGWKTFRKSVKQVPYAVIIFLRTYTYTHIYILTTVRKTIND